MSTLVESVPHITYERKHESQELRCYLLGGDMMASISESGIHSEYDNVVKRRASTSEIGEKVKE
jgi:hypothetical protein